MYQKLFATGTVEGTERGEGAKRRRRKKREKEKEGMRRTSPPGFMTLESSLLKV